MDFVIEVFKVFSDETRLRILRLCDGEELNVHELTEILGMRQPRISNHLRLLRDAGMLVHRREGAWVYYRMAGPEAGPPGAERLWKEAQAWMDAEDFHSEDLERREKALRGRGAPAEKYFEAIGAGWDDIGLRLVDETMRYRLLLALVPPGQTVADVGCGAGGFLGLLCPLARKVIGIDPELRMIEAVRSRAARQGWGNVEARRGSLEDLPLADGEADAVYCNLVLHHSPRPGRAVVEMVRALKPGGLLTICDFAGHSVNWLRDEMADFWLGFEPERLKGWMRRAGLRSIRVAPLGEAMVESKCRGRQPAALSLLAAIGRTGDISFSEERRHGKPNDGDPLRRARSVAGGRRQEAH